MVLVMFYNNSLVKAGHSYMRFTHINSEQPHEINMIILPILPMSHKNGDEPNQGHPEEAEFKPKLSGFNISS